MGRLWALLVALGLAAAKNHEKFVISRAEAWDRAFQSETAAEGVEAAQGGAVAPVGHHRHERVAPVPRRHRHSDSYWGFKRAPQRAAADSALIQASETLTEVPTDEAKPAQAAGHPDRTFCHTSRQQPQPQGVSAAEVRFCYYTADASSVDQPDMFASVQQQLFSDYAPYAPFVPRVVTVTPDPDLSFTAPTATAPTQLVATTQASSLGLASQLSLETPAPAKAITRAPLSVPVPDHVYVPVSEGSVRLLASGVPPPASGRTVPSLSKEAFGAHLKAYGEGSSQPMPGGPMSTDDDDNDEDGIDLEPKVAPARGTELTQMPARRGVSVDDPGERRDRDP